MISRVLADPSVRMQMFECISNALKSMNMRPYRSSTGHRNAQRVNAGTEIISASLAEFTPAAIIPTKIAQILTSSYSFFRADTQGSEKTIHFLQACISGAQVGLAIALLFKSERCSATETDLCKAIFLTQLVYKGILLAGWLPSEFTKAPYLPIQQSALEL